MKSVILSTAIHISTLKKWTREIIRNLDTKEILALCTGNFGICDKEIASLFKIYRKRDVEGARKLLEYILCNDNDNDNDFLDIMILKSLGDVGKIKYVRKIIDNRFVASHEEATRDIAIIVGLMKQSKIHRLASLAKEKNMVLFFYKLLKDNPKVIDYVSAGFTPRDQWSIMVDTIKSENVIAGHIIFSDEWISILDENDINLIFNRIKKLSNYHILILRHCFEANIRLSLQTMINVSLAIDTKDTVICNLLVRYLTHNLDRYDIDSFFEFFGRIAPKLRYVKWILKNNCFFQIFPLLFKNMSPVMINRSLLYILQKINTLSNNRVKDIWQTLFFLDFTILHSFTSDLLAKNIIDNYKDISNDSYVFCSIISNLRPKMRYIKWIFDKGFDYYSLIRYLTKNMKEYLLLRCNRLARSRGVLEDFYMCLNADTLKIIFDKSTEEELYELLPDRIKPFSSREKLLIACYKEFYILDE